MVLARCDVEPEFVAQQVFVERLLKQLRRDLGIAVAVRQAGAHRIRRVQHLVGDERIGVLAMKPGVHEFSSD